MKKINPILYVEDDENDAFLMQHAFKQCGIPNPLVIVCDGREAMDYLAACDETPTISRNSLPCLVILDLNLPRKTGHDVLQWIRKNQTLRTLVVVVFTSSSHDHDVHKAYSLQANAYVVKPPILDGLINTVKRIKDFWLDQNQAPPNPRQIEAKHLLEVG